MPQMHRSFMESFDDYEVPYKLTFEQFAHKMLHKIHIDFNFSYGAFSNEKLVAFIFHSVNRYEGMMAAYNGGTGVLPGHRGNKLPSLLYNRLIPELRSAGVEECVLEVLTTNLRAIRVYEQIGFVKSKSLGCFQFKYAEKLRTSTHRVLVLNKIDPDTLETFGHCSTAFGDTWEQLKYNLDFERKLGVKIDGHLAGYLIFQPSMGRITRFAVHENYRRLGIGRSLFAAAADQSERILSVINVNRDYHGEISFLESIGFINSLDQLEMKLHLN